MIMHLNIYDELFICIYTQFCRRGFDGFAMVFVEVMKQCYFYMILPWYQMKVRVAQPFSRKPGMKTHGFKYMYMQFFADTYVIKQIFYSIL